MSWVITGPTDLLRLALNATIAVTDVNASYGRFDSVVHFRAAADGSALLIEGCNSYVLHRVEFRGSPNRERTAVGGIGPFDAVVPSGFLRLVLDSMHLSLGQNHIEFEFVTQPGSPVQQATVVRHGALTLQIKHRGFDYPNTDDVAAEWKFGDGPPGEIETLLNPALVRNILGAMADFAGSGTPVNTLFSHAPDRQRHPVRFSCYREYEQTLFSAVIAPMHRPQGAEHRPTAADLQNPS